MTNKNPHDLSEKQIATNNIKRLEGIYTVKSVSGYHIGSNYPFDILITEKNSKDPAATLWGADTTPDSEENKCAIKEGMQLYITTIESEKVILPVKRI